MGSTRTEFSCWWVFLGLYVASVFKFQDCEILKQTVHFELVVKQQLFSCKRLQACWYNDLNLSPEQKSDHEGNFQCYISLWREAVLWLEFQLSLLITVHWTRRLPCLRSGDLCSSWCLCLSCWLQRWPAAMQQLCHRTALTSIKQAAIVVECTPSIPLEPRLLSR